MLNTIKIIIYNNNYKIKIFNNLNQDKNNILCRLITRSLNLNNKFLMNNKYNISNHNLIKIKISNTLAVKKKSRYFLKWKIMI